MGFKVVHEFVQKQESQIVRALWSGLMVYLLSPVNQSSTRLLRMSMIAVVMFAVSAILWVCSPNLQFEKIQWIQMY